MRVIIDRLEEGFAVAELGEKTFSIPRALVPGVREGDTVEITVLGRQRPESRESAHDIFDRLRRKSRRRNPPAESHHVSPETAHGSSDFDQKCTAADPAVSQDKDA